MSDSDEAAFESADEGDVDNGENNENKSQKASKDVIASKSSTEAVKSNEKEQGETKSPTATGSTPTNQTNQGGKKGKKQKGKRKGKKENKEKVQDTKDEHIESSKANEETNVDDIKKTEEDISENTSASSTPQEPNIDQVADIEHTTEIDTENKVDTEEKRTEIEGDTEKETDHEPKSTESNTSTENKEDEISEHQAKVLERLSNAAEEQNSGWGSWGSWGSAWGTKLVSTATNSVSTFTSQVGEGFNTVLETVESSLGAMSPEEIAKLQEEQLKKSEESSPIKDQPNSESIDRGNKAKEEEDTVAENKEESENDISKDDSTTSVDQLESKGASGGWFSSVAGLGISSITSVVQETGKHLVDGGIDALELIGKKTYEVVAERDTGLRNTIKNTGSKPNLSVMLREAKEDAEHKAKEEEEFVEARKAHFGAMFDEYHGLVQLEALEMLSNQCEGRVQGLLTSLSTEILKDTKPQLISIKESFEFQEEDEDEDDDDKDHDFKSLVSDGILDLGLNANSEKLVQVQERIRSWLLKCKEEQEKGEQKDPKDIHVSAIQALAEITARSIEQYHKIGQLFLVDPSSPLTAYKEKSATLLKVSKTLCTEVGILSTRYTQCLNTAADDSEDPDSINPLITNVYLEATNSTTYIQDAFQLLFPVVQQAALEAQAKMSS